MAEQRYPISSDDADQALAHMALRANNQGLVMSRDRKTSMMNDGAGATGRWSFYKTFEVGVDGFDDMLEFVNWCGERNLHVFRNHTYPLNRGYGIMGWIEQPGSAEEFRLAWL